MRVCAGCWSLRRTRLALSSSIRWRESSSMSGAGRLGLRCQRWGARSASGSTTCAQDWDAAFELVPASDSLGERRKGCMRAALDDLLDTGRLSTLERWCELAVRAGLQAPVVAARSGGGHARRGRYVEAVAYAESARHESRSRFGHSPSPAELRTSHRVKRTPRPVPAGGAGQPRSEAKCVTRSGGS